MIPARSLGRAGLPRIARSSKGPRIYQKRFQSSSTSSPSSSNANINSSHFAAGVAGGVATGAVLYAVYLLSPAGKTSRTVNKTVKEVNKKYKEAAEKLQEKTPDTDQTIKYMKDFCYSYVAWIPGGRQYVDATFKDIDKIRENHRDEVDNIIKDAYQQFQKLSKSGLSLETGSKALDVLGDLSTKIGNLAAGALSDILDNHPELKQKFGGSIDQLNQMGEQYGPEAKKQVEETWDQVKGIISGGLSADNFEKARKLIQEKVEQVKKLGDEAWKKGMEQAKPYLDKNPKVKELVENNASALKQGDAKALFDTVKRAVESGDASEIEDYVKKAVDKTKSKGSQLSNGTGLEYYFDMIPQGSEILPKLKQLKEVADKRTGEGEQLVKDTLSEIKQVLEKKSQKAQEILDKAKKEAK
ncbi:uncharacterized protein GGS25DRAFT_306837 [Hypoxylon fragiforme]|uniref:uncharacterized protein n=1 Tax=Hypoxylon fragiforme TaxID=63214 RepID=UPI0020C6F08D|nr:uncharacterized protein GGS25DRAFT_306837 [Hypoxylon fragiforme]KAI2606813.1 hypothetical protein GGS25DRAFT_306837 [Hypoxylon fragiforme]